MESSCKGLLQAGVSRPEELEKEQEGYFHRGSFSLWSCAVAVAELHPPHTPPLDGLAGTAGDRREHPPAFQAHPLQISSHHKEES